MPTLPGNVLRIRCQESEFDNISVTKINCTVFVEATWLQVGYRLNTTMKKLSS